MNDVDDGLVFVDSIRMPLELAHAFRRLLHESAGIGPGQIGPYDNDVVIVSNAYATVKCPVMYVPHVRLLWRGFQAGIQHLAKINPPSSAGPAPPREDWRAIGALPGEEPLPGWAECCQSPPPAVGIPQEKEGPGNGQ